MSLRRRRSSQNRVEAMIDVTSLIDAAFILIIFLLISTTFRKKEHAFRITLPTAAHQEVVVQAKRNTVYVTRDGQLFLLEIAPGQIPDDTMSTHKPLSPEALSARLTQWIQDDSELAVGIVAQKDTDYQHVITTLELIQAAGIRHIQLPYDYMGGAKGPENAP